MEIKVNDYVRTDKGTIDKITDENIMIYQVALMGFGEKPIKSSPRIIDLIEVGDYVNGCKVSEIKDKWLILNYADIETYEQLERKNENIKSVLTKEMFEQMNYKIN